MVDAVAGALREAGLSVLTGESAEARGVSDKVRRRIGRSDVFVAVMTRRHPIAGGQAWTTIPWVIEEKGYSLGQNPARPIIALVEQGITVPGETGGLGGDLEVIYFDRQRFEAAEAKLRQVLAHLKP